MLLPSVSGLLTHHSFSKQEEMRVISSVSCMYSINVDMYMFDMKPALFSVLLYCAVIPAALATYVYL